MEDNHILKSLTEFQSFVEHSKEPQVSQSMQAQKHKTRSSSSQDLENFIKQIQQGKVYVDLLKSL
jgi:hypothetical protein